MSEYNYLTGRKELFDNAPADAMVVLEHEDGRLFYAIDHDLGARYWNDDGSNGSKVGLVALHKKTRVIARRSLVAGLQPAQPKRDPIHKSRLDRMQQAQEGLRKAASAKVEVKPKPEPKPAPVKVDPPKVTPKKPSDFGAIPDQDVAVGRHLLSDAGFVSTFALGKAARQGGTFINIHRNGNISLSSKLPLTTGDMLDVQLDPVRGLIRVGKVKSGGKALPKSRMLTSKALVQVVSIPEGEKSVRVHLTETGGWWQGQAELAAKTA